jgi:hypothetical protein
MKQKKNLAGRNSVHGRTIRKNEKKRKEKKVRKKNIKKIRAGRQRRRGRGYRVASSQYDADDG